MGHASFGMVRWWITIFCCCCFDLISVCVAQDGRGVIYANVGYVCCGESTFMDRDDGWCLLV